jgi:hypothetical protein
MYIMMLKSNNKRDGMPAFLHGYALRMSIFSGQAHIAQHMWANAAANTDTAATIATAAAATATTAATSTAAATDTAAAVATVQLTDTPTISNTDNPSSLLTASNCDNFYCSHLPPTTLTATVIGLVESIIYFRLRKMVGVSKHLCTLFNLIQ